MSDACKELIRALWHDGLRIAHIAERAEVTINTVYKVTRDLRDPNGVGERRPYPKVRNRRA